jgi:hypothetical protein
VIAEDREQRLGAAALDDGAGEALVHLERPFEPGQLGVCELGRDRLRQRDEGHLVGHRHEREAELLGLRRQCFRRLRPAEADAEREARQTVLGKPAQVVALRPCALPDAEAGRDQELAAFEPRGRVGQLRDVHPADRVAGAGGARRELEPEAWKARDVPNCQHRLAGAAWTRGPSRCRLRSGRNE